MNYNRFNTLRSFALISSLAVLAACGSSGSDTPQYDVQILSSRADLASGDSVLLQVKVPDNATTSDTRIMVKGVDVTSMLSSTSDPKVLRGLVKGLQSAAGGEKNVIEVGTTNQPSITKITTTNYPTTGTILSGPKKTPWECRTVEAGMGAPLDADCSATASVKYYYRTTDRQFRALPIGNATLPADIVNTTTIDGKQVPYIVRVEGGTINRSIYKIAVLDSAPNTNAAVGQHTYPDWNNRLVIAFTGGCQNNEVA